MEERPKVIDEGSFIASGGILWGWRIIKYPQAKVLVLRRAGRRVSTFSFNLKELPDVLKTLQRILERIGDE